MANSLFDNRYRYDHIYPRGRSGETLRAFDTEHNDRPVVIKRPAPNDAPPIRAGQEVSILNERKALLRLAGHPVLTELLDTGQFFVGGMPHHYIVLERAQGNIIADEVLASTRKGHRLPHLEMLIVVESLLDLLEAAHDQEIVYNDVDAKHLFWDRDAYRLKVIDWGNVVFLEGDEVTPQGISRQTDIAQVGQLLYFILTGGQRADIPRDAGDDFRLDFGQDTEHILPRLQEIVSRAVHPNNQLRYPTIRDLRRDLTSCRQPMERERDTIVNHVLDRLRHNLSKSDLQELSGALDPALRSDPGYPDARKANQAIRDRMHDLDVSAELDAVRIYMEGANWSRAADLLNELRGKAGPQTADLLKLLLDFSMQLLDSEVDPVPDAVFAAMTQLFEEQYVQAAHTLLTQVPPDNAAIGLQHLLAERISSRIPDVLLLRPNLYRLDLALHGLANEGLNIHDGRHLVTEITTLLDQISRQTEINMQNLRDGYQAVVERMTTLNKLLSTAAVQHNLSLRKLPLNSLERALNAAMALADNMHVIGKQAASSPRDATVALDTSRTIDPANPLWNAIAGFLNKLYELLQSYQVYVPAADGTDLSGWLVGSRNGLAPFVANLFDEMLVGMSNGLEIAAGAWSGYSEAVVLGNRDRATAVLAEAAQSVHLVSPTLSGWLNQLSTVVGGAGYVERHAVAGGFGRALADGWESFDRGRLSEAERLAQQAFEISRNETGRFAAKRLLTLASTARDWVERNGILDLPRTQTVLGAVEALYQPEENVVRDEFAAQMPGRETYLKAMNKGLIQVYAGSSAPALRIFYLHAILLGTLDAHEGNLDDARFWRETAVRTLGDYGPRHIGTRALDAFIERRRDLNSAQTLFNRVTNTEALESVEKIRREMEENPRSRLLAAGIHSLREFENALRDWGDGEFHSAGLKLENAIKSVAEVEQAATIELSPYREWLTELQAGTAELHTLSRQMRQAIERRSAEPAEIVHDAHRRIAKITRDLLGDSYAATLFRWYETYEGFLEVYVDKDARRSSKLEQFDELFKEMFIDRHPAYSLYRHWADLTDKSPEFPAPPTDDPTPRISEDEPVESTDYLGSRYADSEEIPGKAPVAGIRLPSRRMIALLVIVIALIIGAVVVISNQAGDQGETDPNIIDGVAVTLVDTPTGGSIITETALALVTTDEATASPGDGTSETPGAISQITPTLVTPTSTPLPPTETATTASAIMSATPLPTETELPTETPLPTETFTPTITPSPTNTLTPTLPPAGLQGWQDMLGLTERIDTLPWPLEWFSFTDGNWRLGVGQISDQEDLQDIIITYSPETLDQFYGNNAPTRIRQAEALLALATYHPALVETEEAYFGLMFQSVEDSAVKAGVYLQVVNPNVINFWLVQGEEATFISQRSVNAINGRISLERDAGNGQVRAYFNDIPVGDPIPFVGAEAAVQPALFVHNGGVIVTVVNWQMRLR